MNKIVEVRELTTGDNFVDIRFINKDEILGKALEKVKSYEPSYLFEVRDNKDKTLLTTYAKENTWAGQRALFLSSIKIDETLPKKEQTSLLHEILTFYSNKAKEDGFDSIMFETSNDALLNLYASENFSITRKLLNFSAKKQVLQRNLSSRANDANFTDYTVAKLNLDDIYKYVSFQDARPGWNTSNLSIVNNQFNTLLSLQDKDGSVFAMCVFDERFGLISRLAVHPLARKKGFGSYIMKEAIARIKTENVFFSDIIDEESSSIIFLKNIGFEVSETKEEMVKEINENYGMQL